MKHIKKFESFKLLTFDMNKIYQQIYLYKMVDKIYCVVIKEQGLRSMTFLRFQEYYESASDEFRGKKFTWDKYIQWYKSPDSPYGEKDVFTYGSDWTGFNLPSEAIENCLKEIDDFNKYDEIMVSIMNVIKEQEEGKFYLIGVDELHTDNDLLDHEMAHGFYYTDSKYRSEMDNLTSQIPEEQKKSISKVILEMGYSHTVLNDEIQAYMSTGIIDRMDESLLDYTPKFERNFRKYKRLHYLSTPELLNIKF